MALLAVLAAPVRAETGRLPTVASISTCADQVLIAVADPGQIVGLSAFAADPGLSFHADRAGEFRSLGTSAEELLKLRPDVVFASLYLSPETTARLEQFGMRVVVLGFADSIAASNAQTMQIARAIGQAARGQALVAEIEAALDDAERLADTGLRALQLQRRGFTSGTDTMLSDLLARFGVRSAAAELGVREIGRVDLETLLKLDPDVLVMGSFDVEADDQGSALLEHPALEAAFPPDRRIVLPGREIVCGGPPLLAGIRTLARELGRIGATQGSGER